MQNLAHLFSQLFQINVDLATMEDQSRAREETRTQAINISLNALRQQAAQAQTDLVNHQNRTRRLEEEVAARGIGGGRPRQPPKMDQKSFPKLTLTEDSDANAQMFRVWETGVLAAVKTNSWEWPASGYGIIAIMTEGKAGKIAPSLLKRIHDGNENPNGDLRTLAQFLQALKEKIVGHCYQQKARAKFECKIQSSNESLISYAGELNELHQESYPEPQEQQDILIDHFIAGLNDKEIMKHLVKHRPATFQEGLTVALQQEGFNEQLRLNQARLNNGGYLPLKSLDKRMQGSKRGGVEAMEVDNVNRKPKPRNFRPVNKKAGARRPYKERFPNKERPKKDARKPRNDKCFECDKPGHIRRDCPKLKRKVNNLQATTEAMTDPENGADKPENSDEESECEEYESDLESDSEN